MNKAFENKKKRVSWTTKLHNKFVYAVNQLGGIEEAKPRNILELMNVENVTRMNVASHLQKYRQKYRENMIKRSSSSVAHQQLGSLSGSGQFHNTAFNSFPTPEWIGTSNSQFVQNNNTNGELNFQSPIGHGHENSITDASINSVTLVNGAVDPKANTPTNSTFNSNLDSNFVDPLQDLMWDFNEGLVTASSSSSQVSALIAQLTQENDQTIQFNSSTEPTLAFTPEQQQ